MQPSRGTIGGVLSRKTMPAGWLAFVKAAGQIVQDWTGKADDLTSAGYVHCLLGLDLP